MPDARQLAAEAHATQTAQFADLVIRQALALANEGIGPSEDRDTDPVVYGAAVLLAGASFNQHELWDAGLLDDEDHAAADCERCRSIGRHLADVEVSRDGGASWSPFPLAPLAGLRQACADNRCHDDSHGNLYRAVGSDADPAQPVLHRPATDEQLAQYRRDLRAQ